MRVLGVGLVMAAVLVLASGCSPSRGPQASVSGTMVAGDLSGHAATVGIARPLSLTATGTAHFVGTIEPPYQLDTSRPSGTVGVWKAIKGRTWHYEVLRCAVTSQTVFVGRIPERAVSEDDLAAALEQFGGGTVLVTGTASGDSLKCASIQRASSSPVSLPWPDDRAPTWIVGMPGESTADVQFFVVDGSTKVNGSYGSASALTGAMRDSWSALSLASNGVPSQTASATIVATPKAAYATQLSVQ